VNYNYTFIYDLNNLKSFDSMDQKNQLYELSTEVKINEKGYQEYHKDNFNLRNFLLKTI